jgi:hypothetical protein
LLLFDQHSRRTLRIVGLLWLLFLLFIVGAGVYLSHRAAQTQSQKFPRLAQPCWSESEDQVAYLSQAPEATAWELWRVERLTEKPSRICQLEGGEWSLLGWLDDDKRLLLQPRVQDIPRFLVVEVNTGRQQEIRFENQGIRLIGVRGGQLFFERAAPAPGASEPSSLTVLRWSAGESELTQVLVIPFETEKLAVESAFPSQDNDWLALVILMGDQEQDRTLWFYDRKHDRLNWSGIRLPCKAMRVAWSPDSRGLVAAVETQTGCDLYAFWNILSGKHTRLSSGEEAHSYQPFWPRGEQYFLLLERRLVYKFDPETLQATRLVADGWEPPKTRDLAVSPRGNYAAYVAKQDDEDQLFRVDFKTQSSHNLLPLHLKTTARKEWWYILGESFDTARRTWTLSE